VATPDVQAHLLADLLTELEVATCGVLSWSGGGPCGYRLAAEFPERVRALVAFAALSDRYEWRMSLFDRLMLGTSVGELLLKAAIARTPKLIVSGSLSAEGSLTDAEVAERTAVIMADPQLLSFVLGAARTGVMRGKRMVGVRNDALQFATMPSLDLPGIQVPTLVVHGDADSEVDPRFGRLAAEEIPGSESLVMARGTHLALFVDPGHREAQQRVSDFLTDDR
jgi:pimeloyl-ACP methyl ester carboxylesterase